MVVATTRLHAVFFFSHIHSVKIPSKATVINLHYYCKKYLTNLLGEFVTAISGYYKKKIGKSYSTVRHLLVFSYSLEFNVFLL
jgi:hypothetical protein